MLELQDDLSCKLKGRRVNGKNRFGTHYIVYLIIYKIEQYCKSSHSKIPIWKYSRCQQSPNIKQSHYPTRNQLQPKHKITSFKILSDSVSRLPVCKQHPQIHNTQTHIEVPSNPSPIVSILASIRPLNRILIGLLWLNCLFFQHIFRRTILILILTESTHQSAIGSQSEQNQWNRNFQPISQRCESYQTSIFKIFLSCKRKISNG